jgi:putative metallohydrolase (TIGR04338 family)
MYQAEYRLRELYDNTVALGNPVVELDGITLTLPPEAKFASAESLQRYVDRAVGPRQIMVRIKRNGSAHYERYTRTIAIPDTRCGWAMREIVVLHELAHHLTHNQHVDAASHGPEFAATFIDLLARVMGGEAALALRVLCKHSGAREGARR